MAVLPIVLYPDPILREKPEKIVDFDANLRDLAKNMLETLYDSRAVGLAANQIGERIRMLVLDCSDDNSQPMVIINPVITQATGEKINSEGCMSFPGFYVRVKRAETIELDYQDAHGHPQHLTATGLLAVCIQHELDHLNGKLFIDYLSPLKLKMLNSKLNRVKKLQKKQAASSTFFYG